VKFSPAEIRRARPLLGTLVEIRAAGAPAASLQRAVDRAFAAVERVHRAMSFHDPASDVARLSRSAHRRPVTVDAWTWSVLRRALWVARATDGLFDPTVGSLLQKWHLLPRTGGGFRAGSWRDITLHPGGTVQFKKRLTVDFGGIAKGFAVDQAVSVLRRAGVMTGMVNAGGDLRMFGDAPQEVHLRHPRVPGRFFRLGTLTNAALATSALTYSQTRYRNRVVNSLVDPRTGQACSGDFSITVVAPETWLADALTKPLFAAPDQATRILARFGAIGLKLDPAGNVTRLGGAFDAAA